MARAQYVLGRLIHAALVLVSAYVFVWVILFALAGDPVRNRLDNPQNPVPPDVAEKIVAYYQLDRTPLEQFWLAVTRLLQGDLGFSLATGRPVAHLLLQGLGSTALLAFLGLIAALVIAFVVAFLAVFPRSETVRRAAQALPLLSLSLPTFLVGLLLLQFFAYQLGWFSAVRDEGFKSLILPALTLAIVASPSLSRVLIQGLSAAKARPFVNVLRAKGLPESRIIVRHILKNGAVPALTLTGLTAGALLAGSVITETIFSRAGLGFVTEQAVRAQDGPVVLGVVLLVAAVVTVFNLVTDLVYPFIDPRIDLTARTARVGRAPILSRRARAKEVVS